LFSESPCNTTITTKTAAKSKPANNKISEMFGSPYSLKRKLKTIINPERIVIETNPATECLVISDHIVISNKAKYIILTIRTGTILVFYKIF